VQGVPQTLAGPLSYHTVEGSISTLYRGPVASLESIKHLGTNGGGFSRKIPRTPLKIHAADQRNRNRRNANYPYFPALYIRVMTGNQRGVDSHRNSDNRIYHFAQHRAPCRVVKPRSLELAVNQSMGNMEGKEVRFGTENSVMFTVSTTSTGTGLGDSMLDSYTAIGGAVPLFLLMSVPFCRRRVRPSPHPDVRDTGRIHSRPDVGRSPHTLAGRSNPKRSNSDSSHFSFTRPLYSGLPAAGIVFRDERFRQPRVHGFTEMLYAFSSAAATMDQHSPV